MMTLNNFENARFRCVRRRGTIMPLLAISLTALCGFVALAVDIGMISTARTQCQNAADAAALAGAASLDGSSSSNLSAASTNAVAAANANKILGASIPASEVTVRHGAYHYDTASQTFSPQFPPVSPDNYNLTEVTITHPGAGAFSRIFGYSGSTITVTAIAAHRPRDVAIVLDYSGSMNNESDLWNNESYLGSVNNSSNNTDPLFPEFGPYKQSYSPLAKLQCTSSDPRVGKCNVSQAVNGVSALVNDFYKNNQGAAASAAFTPATGGITNLLSGGDQYFNVLGSLTTPAKNWKEVTGSASVGFTGYVAFKGYTQGPGYWGKTFFIWPPQPAAASDWRKKYFMLPGGVSPSFGGVCNDNRALWDSTGHWNDPAGKYVINYKKILTWIKAAPSPFPSKLRAGHILLYSAIPADVPASAYDHTQPNSAIANADQRFWKEYIDFTIGVWRDPMGNIQPPGNPSCSYGPDFTCGSATDGAGVQITGPDASDPLGRSYVAALDNPLRPRHRLWFGPMTMIQFMLDTGLLPGTAHDVSMVAAKLGVQGALQDIQNNHPNDMVSLIMFSRPNYTGEASEAGEFNAAVVDLGRDYSGMIDALWFPPNSSTADVRPWDANGLATPRGHGDYTGNTATGYGLRVAYNQLSGSSVLRSAAAGGWGRKNAQKMVILETDGMANTATNAATTNSGAYNSYYNIRSFDAFTTSGVSASQDALDVATRICALDSDTAGIPGFSTPRKTAKIHTLAFGSVFESTAEGAEPAAAVSFLQQISTIGATTFPASSSDPTNGYKWCIGDLSQRQSKLQTAFSTIMDSDLSVILVK